MQVPKTQEQQHISNNKKDDKKIEEKEIEKIVEWVDHIKDPVLREHALEELSKKRENVPDLALYIWFSPGTVATLLQEIISTYQYLVPPNSLSVGRSNRACSVLALFQCVAAHQETRSAFLNAQIPYFLYPFLNTVNKAKSYEYIRLTALGVIGALVKGDNAEVISFLLNTELIPLCLRIMERGSELSKTVACFILQRILLDDAGLRYICEKPERLFAIDSVLGFMVRNKPSPRLTKHIIRSYCRLAENSKAHEILKKNLPEQLTDKTFTENLDESSKKWLFNLVKNLKSTKNVSPSQKSIPNIPNMPNTIPNMSSSLPDLNSHNNINGPISNNFSVMLGPYPQNYMIPNDFNNQFKDRSSGFNMGNNFYKGFQK